LLYIDRRNVPTGAIFSETSGSEAAEISPESSIKAFSPYVFLFGFVHRV
jgi:hypothetical protein